jgi:hypothetical protein
VASFHELIGWLTKATRLFFLLLHGDDYDSFDVLPIFSLSSSFYSFVINTHSCKINVVLCQDFFSGLLFFLSVLVEHLIVEFSKTIPEHVVEVFYKK